MLRIMLLMTVCAALTGCATQGKLSTLPEVEDKSTACNVFIIRKSSMFGAAISYTIAIDHQDIVAITSGDYTKITVASGSHIITAKYPRQMFLGTAESSMGFECKPGKNTYILVSPGITVGLEVLSEGKGSSLIQTSEYVDLR